ncbi:Carboxy-terminal processing protease CtpB precursor [Posidoniimonas polymericola]|uniref:Carboxy-terminal processing protease CtpB n=1 Tax=Posidoniimonas polymericola TaxID=2528002 RepID=A0A5C5YU47_9BACT|nr:S41 family peptidase [Posidoniimonas polymericola]TWT78286.1 Carboxy-terminal processing protease CtpB precursor [Posidoniimonas polymericola]
MSRRNLSLLLCVLAASLLCRMRGGTSPQSGYVAQAYTTINDWSLEPPSRRALINGAMRGMVAVLNEQGDAHSQYIGPRRAQPFMDEMRQEFGGIGVRIRMTGDPARLLLVGIPEPGSPAALAGVKPNDHVVQIDTHPTAGLGMQEVIELMRGPVGEPIVLRVLHDGETEPVDLPMVRDTISVASVFGDRRLSDGSWQFRLDEDPRVAHVRLTNFGSKTVSELTATLEGLTTLGVEALVLDVRENPGGALDAAIGVSDLFLPEGAPIVETRGRRGVVEESYEASGDGPYLAMPVVVLVNGDSASASEIVAACLQDDGRAMVGGQRSYGKGTVQRLFPLESGTSYLKLTTSSYWRPSGVNIHRLSDAPEADPWGVSPDPELAVSMTDDEHLDFLRWRERRDLIVFDADTGEVLSTPQIEHRDAEGQAVEVDPGYEDAALLRAVEYLQSQLDAGA